MQPQLQLLFEPQPVLQPHVQLLFEPQPVLQPHVQLLLLPEPETEPQQLLVLQQQFTLHLHPQATPLFLQQHLLNKQHILKSPCFLYLYNIWYVQEDNM